MNIGKSKMNKHEHLVKTTVQSRFLVKKAGVPEKSKVASNHTWFIVVLFHKNQEGRQQWHETLVKGTAKFINVLRQ